MGVRLKGNDQVAPEMRAGLRRLKALKQGLELDPGRTWWPALDALTQDEQAQVRRDIAEVRRQNAALRVFELTGPRSTTDGRRYA